jgi:hypothetical protein
MFGLEFDRAAALKQADRQTRLVLRGCLNGVREVARDIEQDLEAETQRAVPGRLYRGWQSDALKRIAKQPTAWVYFSGGKRSQGAITHWTQPGRLTAQDGGWLAIPLPAAGSRGRANFLTPGEWERQNGAKLRFVFRPGRPGLLVLDEGTLSGKKQVGRLNSARRRATGRGNMTIPIFVLIPHQEYRNAFSIETVINRQRGRMDDVIEREVKTELNKQ